VEELASASFGLKFALALTLTASSARSKRTHRIISTIEVRATRPARERLILSRMNRTCRASPKRKSSRLSRLFWK
jgi:hypothetical protein